MDHTLFIYACIATTVSVLGFVGLITLVRGVFA